MKITSITHKLQEIYIDLWRLHYLPLLLGKTYVGLFVDKFTCKSWVLLLRSKDKFFNTFKFWLLRTKKACKEKLQCLQINGGREFINVVLKNLCNKKNINIGYAALYIYKENEIAKRY